MTILDDRWCLRGLLGGAGGGGLLGRLALRSRAATARESLRIHCFGRREVDLVARIHLRSSVAVGFDAAE